MQLESDSDLVLLGKLLHETSYNRKSIKEVEIERIKIDFIEKTNEIHEVKRSRKIEKAHIYQLLYYIYFLKKKADIKTMGFLDYPLLRRKVKVELTADREKELENILTKVKGIINQEKPQEAEWKSYCRDCAYIELCWG
jgi:CRISPR-associated exonuclease Cas4